METRSEKKGEENILDTERRNLPLPRIEIDSFEGGGSR